MKTYIVYSDESGDPGNTQYSSNYFILTSIYMPIDCVWENRMKIIQLRKELYTMYRLPENIEMHTQHFMQEKNDFRDIHFTQQEKCGILNAFAQIITQLDLKIVNVIIRKNCTVQSKNVLNQTFRYMLQRIETAALKEGWCYFYVTDNGRIDNMRLTANAMRKTNWIPSHFGEDYNQPITNLVDGIFTADSRDSYFIQIADFIAFFVHLYCKAFLDQQPLPKRISEIVTMEKIINLFELWKKNEKLNLEASKKHSWGFVIY